MRFTAKDADILAQIQLWRRDVRHFRTDPIPEFQIERLERSMDCAPSVGNARPWRILRVESPELRAAVRAEFERCNSLAADTYPEDRQRAYRALKLAGLDRAPLQLAVFSAIDPQTGHTLGRRTMPETLHQSTAMAIHALWLTARAENLGLGMVSILDPSRMEEIFSIGRGWVFSAYLCLGVPEFDDDQPLLHRTGWQESAPTKWERR
jgi:5,6-dimethylbenzimidazole synthase